MVELGAATHVPGPGEQLSVQTQLSVLAAFQGRFQVTAGSAQRIAQGPRVGAGLGGAGGSVGMYGEGAVTHEADTPEGPAAHLSVDDGLDEGPCDSGYHVGDGWCHVAAYDFIANGFELLERSASLPDIDFLDHDQVVGRYYPCCAGIAREASGARLVAAFDHNIRSVSGNRSRRRIEGGQLVQPPIHRVHGDYTLTSRPQRLRDLAKPPTSNDTYRTVLCEGETLLKGTNVERVLRSGRFALINLWRNIARDSLPLQVTLRGRPREKRSPQIGSRSDLRCGRCRGFVRA